MSLTKISGVVSGLQVNSNIAVNTTVTNNTDMAPGTTTTSVTSTTTLSFRIDNRPANMKVRINLSNGDNVTAAVIQKGEMEVIALNNHTTKTMYWIPEPGMAVFVGSGITFLIGFVTRAEFYGILFLLGSGFYLFKNLKTKKMITEAKAMVA